MSIDEKKKEIKNLNLILNQFFDFIYEISEISNSLDKKSRRVIKGLKKLSSYLNKNLQELEKKQKNVNLNPIQKIKPIEKLKKKNERKIIQSEIFSGSTEYEKEIENIFMLRVQVKILEINNLKIENFKIKKQLKILHEEKIKNPNNYLLNENFDSKNHLKNSKDKKIESSEVFNLEKYHKKKEGNSGLINESKFNTKSIKNFEEKKNEKSQNIFLKGNLNNKKLYVSKNYESKYLLSEKDNLLNVLSVSKYSKNDFKEFTLGKNNHDSIKYDNIDFIKIIFIQCKTLEEGI